MAHTSTTSVLNPRESSVTAQITDAPQIPPSDTPAAEIHQPNRNLVENPNSETEGESTSATSASSVIGTKRQRTATRSSSESDDYSDENDSDEDERGDHSASTEMAANSPVQFTPSSQGSTGDMSHVLDPEDL